MMADRADALFEEMERVKIRFIAAYEKLVQKGLITEEQFQDILDALEHIDELSEGELEERLGLFKRIGPDFDPANSGG